MPTVKYMKNGNGRYDCPEPGCERVGAKGLTSPQAVGTHRRYEHTYKRGDDSKALAVRKEINGNGRDATIPGVRTMKRLMASAQGRHTDLMGDPMPDHGASEDRLHYCPGCACDLHHIKAPLNPAIRASALVECPRCHLNLAAVAVALRPDVQQMDPQQVAVVFDTILAVIH